MWGIIPFTGFFCAFFLLFHKLWRGAFSCGFSSNKAAIGAGRCGMS